MIPSATSTTAPSTQPPETAPTTSPFALTAIFVPAGWGADFFVSTTVANAIRSPRPAQAASASRTALMKYPRIGARPR